MASLSQIRIVCAGIRPPFFGPLLRIHLDRSVQAALLGEMVHLVVHPTHIIGDLALFLSFLICLHNSFVLAELRATGACPGRSKSLTLLTFLSVTLLSENIVFFE